MRVTSRKIHRWLSVVIGIQLLLWTLSGLIFSWNPIDRVRGSHLVRPSQPADLAKQKVLGIQEILRNVRLEHERPVVRVELRSLLGDPVYEVTLGGEGTQHVLMDANSGKQISPISKEMAEQIAVNDFLVESQVESIEWIDKPVGPHWEYREKELPVWKVEMDHRSGTRIYISANRGVVTARRNHRWRLFDFFWMLHTMDYAGRDNFNTWLLRIMSVLGVVSVLTGFWLWARTTRFFRRKRKRTGHDRTSPSKPEA